MIDFPLMNFAYRGLAFLHFHPHQRFNIFFYSMRIFYFVACAITAFGVALTFRSHDAPPEMIKICVSLTVTNFYIWPKVYALLVHKTDFGANLDDMKKFWVLKEMELSEKCKAKIMKSTNRNLYLIKCFNYSTPLIIVVFFLEVYSNFHVCFPESLPGVIKSDFVKFIIKFSVSILIFFNCLFVTTFDTLTVCTIVYLKMQFDMLGCRLRDVIGKSEMNTREEVIKCIKYHCFLIRFVERVKSSLSIYCLFAFITVLASSGNQMYFMAYAEDIEVIASLLGYVFYVLLQYSLYCFPMSNLTEKALWISDVTYESNWELEGPSIRELAAFIMKRSQKKISIMGGGFVSIDRENFASICRHCISIFTLAKALKEKRHINL